ncbi:MAG: replicative DNA helicase [Homoserinimonas sp.]
MTDEYTDADAPSPEPADEPLWDLQAEQSVLGGMLLKNSVVDDVMEEMIPRDLYQPKHELIARAIVTLTSKNLPADVIAVTDELRRAGNLDRSGGAHYLHELTSIVPTAANAGYYAHLVHELAVKRRLVEVGTRIKAMGNASEGHVDELVDRARVELETVATGKRRSVQKVGDTLKELIDSLSEKPTYVASPWEALDKLIGGLEPGSLYVVAARPGGGKSIALLQIAARLAHEGMVAMSSLEMREAELQKRLLAQYGPVHMTSLKNHTLNDDEWKRVAEARARIQDAPIFIDETPAVTLAQIRSHARSVARRGPLAGIAVDYLQLVHGEGESRQAVVGATAEGLKALAKDIGVPVIAAAQLKRAGERRGKRELPTLDDLRESGGIEQAADVVLLMDRDTRRSPHDVSMVVAKSRSGESGQFKLQWQAEFARLRDKQWSPSALFEEEGM